MSRTGRRTGNRGRWSFLRSVCVGLAVSFAVSGCKSRSDLVEAELRTREREVRELRTALQRSEMLNSALTHPAAIAVPTFTPPPSYPGEVVAPPAAVMSGTVKEVVLGRGTGGVDNDGVPVPPTGGSKEVVPPPFDGPMLNPGAWFRERDPAAWLTGARPMTQSSTSAKPLDREPAKLLEPQSAVDE